MKTRLTSLMAAAALATVFGHGVGYQAGLSLASSMTFSYLAVRHMIASQKEPR